MKIHLDSPPEDARIELVPLIDVIFCILTFFLLAALQLTRQQAINVDLPKASTGVPQMREMLLVSIDNFGQTYIDQLPVNVQQLERVLRSYRDRNPTGLMVLYAPKDAKYNNVVQVLDRMRSVGGDRVALATLPAGAASPTASPSPFNPKGTLPPLTNPGTQPRTSPPGALLNPNQYQFPVNSQQPAGQNQFQLPPANQGQQPRSQNQFQFSPGNSGQVPASGSLGAPSAAPAPATPNPRATTAPGQQ